MEAYSLVRLVLTGIQDIPAVLVERKFRSCGNVTRSWQAVGVCVRLVLALRLQFGSVFTALMISIFSLVDLEIMGMRFLDDCCLFVRVA